MMSAYAPYGGDSYDDDEVEDVQSGDSLGRWLG